MKAVKKQIPNLITCINVICGSLAIVSIINNAYLEVLFLLSIALIADFLDGFVARLLKVQSEMGKEMDSLADVISFGLVPAFICVSLMAESISGKIFNVFSIPKLAFIGFLIVAFAALRLAKFNTDTRQSDAFIGLPTPAITMFMLGLWLFKHLGAGAATFPWIYNTTPLVVIIVFFSLIMISEINFFSLKVKKLDIKKYPFQFILIIGSIILIFLCKFASFSIIILFYIILSYINNFKK